MSRTERLKSTSLSQSQEKPPSRSAVVSRGPDALHIDLILQGLLPFEPPSTLSAGNVRDFRCFDYAGGTRSLAKLRKGRFGSLQHLMEIATNSSSSLAGSNSAMFNEFSNEKAHAIGLPALFLIEKQLPGAQTTIQSDRKLNEPYRKCHDEKVKEWRC